MKFGYLQTIPAFLAQYQLTQTTTHAQIACQNAKIASTQPTAYYAHNPITTTPPIPIAHSTVPTYLNAHNAKPTLIDLYASIVHQLTYSSMKLHAS